MKAEEIEKERADSGWNPYVGEEEKKEELPEMSQQYPVRRDMEEPMMEEGPGIARPYFRQPEYRTVLEMQKQEERSYRNLQSMYPETAKLLLPFVEEACDKMEYEGSPMFDSYPDPTTLWRMEEIVAEQVKDQFPQQPEKMPDDLMSMNYSGPGRGKPGDNWLGDLIRVLLIDEMHHRRCRHNRCRPGRFY